MSRENEEVANKLSCDVDNSRSPAQTVKTLDSCEAVPQSLLARPDLTFTPGAGPGYSARREEIWGAFDAGTEANAMTKLHGLLLLAIVFTASSACAEDFCVENKVYLGSDVVESKTLFHAGRVYDFLVSPQEVTIFDPPGKRFVVLDPDREVKTEITLATIEAFAQRLKAEALARQVPLLVFLAEPKFDETLDDSTGELKLASTWLEYRAKLVSPKKAEAAVQYADYSNWQTKLNALLRPGSFPPFARLELNSALDRRESLPTEVHLTRFSQQASKRQVSFRSEHRLQWRLLDSDLKQLERAAKQLATFEAVSLTDYQRPLTKSTE